MIDIFNSNFYKSLYIRKREFEKQLDNMSDELSSIIRSGSITPVILTKAAEIEAIGEKVFLLDDLIDDFDKEFYKEEE